MAVLSLITSQDGQERETPERMPLRRARRRPVCWIEANISAMSYHQSYTRLPIFVLSYFLSLSLSLSPSPVSLSSSSFLNLLSLRLTLLTRYPTLLVPSTFVFVRYRYIPFSPAASRVAGP